MFANLDVTRILSLGTVGLGFLLALLAFRLLHIEQSLTKPREGMLKATNRFMVFSFSLCLIGLSSELYRIYESPSKAPANQPLPQGYYFELQPDEFKLAKSTSQDFLKNLDSGQIENAYNAFDNRFKSVTNLDDYKAMTIAATNMVGDFKDRRFILAQKFAKQMEGGELVNIYLVTYSSIYSKIPGITETVWLIKDEKKFKVVYLSRV